MHALRNAYLTERYQSLPQWHDCFVLDATILSFGSRIKVKNLSGEHHKAMHPQAVSELGRFVDHCKGPRKVAGRSNENKFRATA
jgi:hypothetical protein